jgi:hypothetical protein
LTIFFVCHFFYENISFSTSFVIENLWKNGTWYRKGFLFSKQAV